MSQAYAPPAGPPPSNPRQPSRQDSLDTDIPDEPPPAYTPAAGMMGDTTVQAGPSRMDFSGPPPMPDRLQQNITGVGEGFGQRPQHTGNAWVGNGGGGGNAFIGNGGGGGTPGGVTPQPTGGSSFHANNPFSDSNRPPPPPQHSSRLGSYAPPPGPPPKSSTPQPPPAPSSPGAGPSRPPQHAPSPAPVQDLSPTEAPTPGRPLLRNGQMLVYPKNHHCIKCNNTGYKANDPSNPCNSDWRKYGKPYNSALAASYATATGPNSNPSVISSSNFQKPLPNFTNSQSHYHPNHNPHSHLPPPPGAWNTYPGQGQSTYRPMPPPPTMPMGGHGAYVSHMPGVPPGALVVQPGDPRIGGRICQSCYGSGREIGFFGFDEGRCYHCRGLGRVF